eukprot:c13882_g2_i1 orf=575-2842(+)
MVLISQKGSGAGGIFGCVSYIRQLCKNGGLEEAFRVVDSMEKRGLSISRDIIYSLLQGCNGKKDLAYARRIHGLMHKHGLSSIAALGDQLIRLFTACRSLHEANEAFSDVLKPSVFTWNSLISAHSKLGEGVKALCLYEKMQQDGVVPDRVTMVCMSNACGCVEASILGMLVHHQAIQHAFEANTVLANSLINMYAKCGLLAEAHKLFDTHAETDMVTWTVIISGYAAQGQGFFALDLYARMHYDGVKPNKAVMLCAVKACVCIGALKQGQLIHEEIMEDGLELDMVIMSSIIDMYAKCGCLAEAGKVFNELPTCDVVVWSTMIDGYAQSDHAIVALEVFGRMLQAGGEPNEATFVGVLKACGTLGAMVCGRLAHTYIVGQDVEIYITIGTALVDMYAKCKSLEDAYAVFTSLADRNLVSWGAVISGFSDCGQALTALKLFNEMLLQGIEPNSVILLCVVKACGSVEALEQGRLIHAFVVEMGFESDQAIGNTLVDLYAKSGDLEAAHTVFDRLSQPDAVSFGALITGYSHQGCSALALDLFGKMQKKGILPERATFLSLLKACSSAGAVGHGKLIHEQIIKNGFDSAPLIMNALVDMYVKTGKIDEARQIFAHISNYDVVSCDSMIGGYTQQGDLKSAMQLMEDMCHIGVEPDNAMFASMLTAYSSAGLLNEGHGFFTCIKGNNSISPTSEHYGSVIDLLGRAGQLHMAEDMSVTMPMPPDSITRTSLLANCKTYSNIERGRQYFGQAVELGSH